MIGIVPVPVPSLSVGTMPCGLSLQCFHAVLPNSFCCHIDRRLCSNHGVRTSFVSRACRPIRPCGSGCTPCSGSPARLVYFRRCFEESQATSAQDGRCCFASSIPSSTCDFTYTFIICHLCSTSFVPDLFSDFLSFLTRSGL
jgi:hypothetical protein